MTWRFVRTIACAVLFGAALLAWPSHPRAVGRVGLSLKKVTSTRHVVTATLGHPTTGHIIVDGNDYTYSVSLDIQDPSGAEPEPVSVMDGPFADERDVIYPLMCTGFIEDDSGYADNFDLFNNLLDPNGNKISPTDNHHGRYGATLSGSDTWNLDNPVEGTYTCSTEFYVDGNDLGAGTLPGTLTYVNPTGETTLSPDQGRWNDSPWQTAFVWAATLSVPGNANLAGRTVQETDGGGASDTCHYGGSPIDEFTGIPPLQIQIQSNSYNDAVGWSEYAVACYRGSGTGCNVTPPLPCYFAANQNMSINVPGSSYYQYKTNELTGTIGTDKVFSSRDTESTSRSW